MNVHREKEFKDQFNLLFWLISFEKEMVQIALFGDTCSQTWSPKSLSRKK
jgi:hypothetical protein